MKRRDFMAASCLAGFAPLSSMAAAADQPATPPKKEFYALQVYYLPSAEKQQAMVDFLGKAVIPAWNRLGVEPVGVFHMTAADNPDVPTATIDRLGTRTYEVRKQDDPNLFVLLPHTKLDVLVRANARLMGDKQFRTDAGTLLDDAMDDPAFQRIESSLLQAFDGHPKLQMPSKKDTRVFQLRIYESHNIKKAKKKIAMFNQGGELEIFRRTGLTSVFFGETLIGVKVPNLTYMLGFDDMAAGEAAWTKFKSDPAWLALKDDPQYKDTVSNITNLFLRPAACSQI